MDSTLSLHIKCDMFKYKSFFNIMWENIEHAAADAWHKHLRSCPPSLFRRFTIISIQLVQ